MPRRSASILPFRRKRRRTPRFDAKWQAKRDRKRGLIRAFRTTLVLACALALAWIASALGWIERTTWRTTDTRVTICGDSGSSNQCVIDGDTIVIGFGEKQRRIRLTGYDAPEADGKCAAERVKAAEATVALRDWLNAEPYQLSGGDDPPYDRYGRELRSARRIVNGTDKLLGKGYLADHMIARGLAEDNGWGADQHGWCR